MADQAAPPGLTRDDFLAGAALGILLGVLTGLSAAPVVSTIITALVALLAGALGLSEKIAISPTGLRRLMAFALAAALTTPAALWVRTHDLLSPSLSEQRAELRRLGYADGSQEQRDLLLQLRLGVVRPLEPPQPNTAPQPQPPIPEVVRGASPKAIPPSSAPTPKAAVAKATTTNSVLFSNLPPALCQQVWRATSREELLSLISAEPAAAALDKQLKRLPAEWSAEQLEIVKSLACPGG